MHKFLKLISLKNTSGQIPLKIRYIQSENFTSFDLYAKQRRLVRLAKCTFLFYFIHCCL